MTRPAHEPDFKRPTRAFLAYTREQGWCVYNPVTVSEAYILGYRRPGGKCLFASDCLAIADLPPVPDAAL